MTLEVLLVLDRISLGTIEYFYCAFYSPPVFRNGLILCHICSFIVFWSCYGKRIARAVSILLMARQLRTVVQKLTWCIVRYGANCWHFLQFLLTLSQIIYLFVSFPCFCVQLLTLFSTWTLHPFTFFDEVVNKGFVYDSEFRLLWNSLIVSTICTIDDTVVLIFIDLLTQDRTSGSKWMNHSTMSDQSCFS